MKTHATLPNKEGLAHCFAVHRSLAEHAQQLARRLATRSPDAADQLRLGSSCVDIAAQQALAAREERDAIYGWSQCSLGERQIRRATYQALRGGHIETRDYDSTFDAAIAATRARHSEIQRLRRQLFAQV
jgi:hypothetical protein